MKMRPGNVYVVDTSVLIDYPDIFYKLGNNQIVVPTAVIRELDGIKRNPDPHERKYECAKSGSLEVWCGPGVHKVLYQDVTLQWTATDQALR